MPLEIPGKEYFKDSRDFLSLDKIPDHVTFVGAGIISMEFASLCLSLGKKVDIVDVTDIALGQYPREYTSKIVEKMKGQGANFHFNSHATKLEKKGEKYVLYTQEGEAIESDYVLVAVGREANVNDMNLEGIGVKDSKRGIKVDSHLRTSVKNIYASGDVIDKSIPKLTPTAEFESNYIALDIVLPINKKIKYPVVPNLVFTLPRIAQVGVKVEEARKNPAKYRVEKVELGKTLSWLNKNQTYEEALIVIDKKRHIVGAVVYSDDAGVYIDVLTLLINLKVGVNKLRKMIFAFPTQTYGLISSLTPLLLKK